MDKANPTVLSFYNSLIRRSDIELLEGPHWLNDNIIGFFFEYLENFTFKDFADRVSFVCPAIVQFMKRGDSSQVGPFLDSMDLRKKEYVFMAVNDSSSQFSPGGTHWSLLILHLATSTFRHYDSLGGCNERAARSIVRNLTPHLCRGSNSNFVAENSPQQTNTFDCGVHVILNANVLARHFLMNEPVQWYKDDDVAASRGLLRDKILDARVSSD